jgi:hypothetical protein
MWVRDYVFCTEFIVKNEGALKTLVSKTQWMARKRSKTSAPTTQVMHKMDIWGSFLMLSNHELKQLKERKNK